eukprot:gene26340-17437_t
MPMSEPQGSETAAQGKQEGVKEAEMPSHLFGEVSELKNVTHHEACSDDPVAVERLCMKLMLSGSMLYALHEDQQAAQRVFISIPSASKTWECTLMSQIARVNTELRQVSGGGSHTGPEKDLSTLQQEEANNVAEDGQLLQLGKSQLLQLPPAVLSKYCRAAAASGKDIPSGSDLRQSNTEEVSLHNCGGVKRLQLDVERVILIMCEEGTALLATCHDDLDSYVSPCGSSIQLLQAQSTSHLKLWYVLLPSTPTEHGSTFLVKHVACREQLVPIDMSACRVDAESADFTAKLADSRVLLSSLPGAASPSSSPLQAFAQPLNPVSVCSDWYQDIADMLKASLKLSRTPANRQVAASTNAVQQVPAPVGEMPGTGLWPRRQSEQQGNAPVGQMPETGLWPRRQSEQQGNAPVGEMPGTGLWPRRQSEQQGNAPVGEMPGTGLWPRRQSEQQGNAPADKVIRSKAQEAAEDNGYPKENKAHPPAFQYHVGESPHAVAEHEFQFVTERGPQALPRLKQAGIQVHGDRRRERSKGRGSGGGGGRGSGGSRGNGSTRAPAWSKMGPLELNRTS